MDIKTVVLKTITESTKRDDSTKGWGMWVLQYFVDGKSVAVKLVCGEFYEKDGERRYAAKGMKPSDFESLKPAYSEFLAFSKNPPAMPGGVAKKEDFEETPF